MNQILFFLFSLCTTMCVMNFYFHFKLAKGGIVHFGRISEADNDIDGSLMLKIQLRDQRLVTIKAGPALSDKAFNKFFLKNINNPYEVLEFKEGETSRFIHNGSYRNKAVLFLIGSITIAVTLFFNSQV